MTTKLNPGKPDGGETRGTPEKVCDWKADGWTIDPKILGEIEDDPRVRAEGDPGLEMVEAILLAADWKPLAPEATTKEPRICAECNQPESMHSKGREQWCPAQFQKPKYKYRPMAFIPVAPGEAVGRPSEDDPTCKPHGLSLRYCLVCWDAALGIEGKDHRLMASQCIAALESALFGVRRERDQLRDWKESAMRQLTKQDALRKVLTRPEYLGRDIYEAAADLLSKLESQVRELTAGPITSKTINALPEALRVFIHDLETKCDPAGDIRTIAELRSNQQGLLALVAELRAAVEKLERERWTCAKCGFRLDCCEMCGKF